MDSEGEEPSVPKDKVSCNCENEGEGEVQSDRQIAAERVEESDVLLR